MIFDKFRFHWLQLYSRLNQIFFSCASYELISNIFKKKKKFSPVPAFGVISCSDPQNSSSFQYWYSLWYSSFYVFSRLLHYYRFQTSNFSIQAPHLCCCLHWSYCSRRNVWDLLCFSLTFFLDIFTVLPIPRWPLPARMTSGEVFPLGGVLSRKRRVFGVWWHMTFIVAFLRYDPYHSIWSRGPAYSHCRDELSLKFCCPGLRSQYWFLVMKIWFLAMKIWVLFSSCSQQRLFVL